MSIPLILSARPITLDLRTTFRIAHGASDQRYNVIVHISAGDLTGWGEAAGVPYLGETQAGILEYLSQLPDPLGEIPDREVSGAAGPAWIGDTLDRLPPGSRAARAAVDLALHDLWGQRLGLPLYSLIDLDPAVLPLTSLTIAIDTPAVMAERALASGATHIKVKLGAPDPETDLAIIAAIRRALPAARLRADANAGWRQESALRLIPRLAEHDLELIEQPLPIGDLEGLRSLRRGLRGAGVTVPLFADESVKTAADVEAHAAAVDGVVIKLMKTGGLREARRAIGTARRLGLGIMLSCMIETSLGVTAAAHLAPLCDYLDLDGPLLIKNDPFLGITYDGYQIHLPEGPGLGVTAR